MHTSECHTVHSEDVTNLKMMWSVQCRHCGSEIIYTVRILKDEFPRGSVSQSVDKHSSQTSRSFSISNVNSRISYLLEIMTSELNLSLVLRRLLVAKYLDPLSKSWTPAKWILLRRGTSRRQTPQIREVSYETVLCECSLYHSSEPICVSRSHTDKISTSQCTSHHIRFISHFPLFQSLMCTVSQ